MTKKIFVFQAFQYAQDWTAKTGVLTYFGAWMPQDNKDGDIDTNEAIEFSKYFIDALKPIPWSLNVLDVYYDTKNAEWRTGKQEIKDRLLDIPKVSTLLFCLFFLLTNKTLDVSHVNAR